MTDPAMSADLFRTLTESVCGRLAANQRVRRSLPDEGRLRIDRQLPFLFVYRRPIDRRDNGTRDLVTSEAAYLAASGAACYHASLAELCGEITDLMREYFGLFLLVEVWSEPISGEPRMLESRWHPSFRIVTSEPESLPSTVEALRRGLERIRIGWGPAQVEVTESEPAPPGMPCLFDACQPRNAGCMAIGLGVDPVYRNSATGELFPIVLRQFRREVSSALRRTVFAFAGSRAEPPAVHFNAFGPSALVQASAEVDLHLHHVAESYDFLMQATPLNSVDAWRAFHEQGNRPPPKLYYRPLPYDPVLLKRRLYEIQIERVEDATLAYLFWEKQDELGRQLTALSDVDSPQFLYGSLQLYGRADPALLELALSLLKLPRHPEAGDERLLDCDQVVAKIRTEIERYRRLDDRFQATVEVRDDIASGMMVSRSRLLVARDVQLTPIRLRALLHHEVGTHVVTYINGQLQRFSQLATGLAGYETLQEGLAVLSELLTGGLSTGRVRTLAGRVVAVESLVEGYSFGETYTRLVEDFGFSERAAFSITLRVYRAGGLTKDVIYLRGLRDVMAYLQRGHEIEPLMIGKMGLRHIPFMQELRLRGIIDPPAILPRYLTDKRVAHRLEQCRHASLEQLLHEAAVANLETGR